MTTVTDDRPEDVGLRERKKLQTRTAIHEAAFRLIDEHGLEATTVDQISQEADVSGRTFFNYYPSKAAAALDLGGAELDDEVQASFRSASGGLVDALCAVIASTAERGPSHLRVRQLIARRPELLTTLSQMMTEVRGQFVALAVERSSSLDQAELAVTLVMAALSRVMHDENRSAASLSEQLRTMVGRLVEVGRSELAPLAV
jgi:AcrR family transcriptional regulator